MTISKVWKINLSPRFRKGIEATLAALKRDSRAWIS